MMSHGHQQGRMAITLAALGSSMAISAPAHSMPSRRASPDTWVCSPPRRILSIVSLFFWTIMIVVSFKYVLLVLRADDKGEGDPHPRLAGLPPPPGQVARPAHAARSGRRGALHRGCGDHPAISVLSAVEGLQVITPELAPFVLPITLTVLVILFGAQHYGTAGIGRLFGPIMLLWFGVLAALGAYGSRKTPPSCRRSTRSTPSIS